MLKLHREVVRFLRKEFPNWKLIEDKNSRQPYITDGKKKITFHGNQSKDPTGMLLNMRKQIQKTIEEDSNHVT